MEKIYPLIEYKKCNDSSFYPLIEFENWNLTDPIGFRLDDIKRFYIVLLEKDIRKIESTLLKFTIKEDKLLYHRNLPPDENIYSISKDTIEQILIEQLLES